MGVRRRLVVAAWQQLPFTAFGCLPITKFLSFSIGSLHVTVIGCLSHVLRQEFSTGQSRGHLLV